MADTDRIAEAKDELFRRGMDASAKDSTKALEQFIRSEGGFSNDAADLPDLSAMSMSELHDEFLQLVGAV